MTFHLGVIDTRPETNKPSPVYLMRPRATKFGNYLNFLSLLILALCVLQNNAVIRMVLQISTIVNFFQRPRAATLGSDFYSLRQLIMMAVLYVRRKYRNDSSGFSNPYGCILF